MYPPPRGHRLELGRGLASHHPDKRRRDGRLALAGVRYDKWIRFMLPLMGLLAGGLASSCSASPR